MGIVTLILVLAGVSGLVCLAIERDGDVGPPLREQAVRMGRATLAMIVRTARTTSESLLRADELLRSRTDELRRPRRVEDLRSHHVPVAMAADFRPSRLLALIELLILAALTGAAIAAALAGLAWGVSRLLT
jgi:imidazolonepropionase-like amidohydrolase